MAHGIIIVHCIHMNHGSIMRHGTWHYHYSIHDIHMTHGIIMIQGTWHHHYGIHGIHMTHGAIMTYGIIIMVFTVFI